MHTYKNTDILWLGGPDDITLFTFTHSAHSFGFVLLGENPQPRAGYQIPEPNGCNSYLVGFQVNEAVGGLFEAPTAQNYTIKPI